MSFDLRENCSCDSVTTYLIFYTYIDKKVKQSTFIYITLIHILLGGGEWEVQERIHHFSCGVRY